MSFSFEPRVTRPLQRGDDQPAHPTRPSSIVDPAGHSSRLPSGQLIVSTAPLKGAKAPVVIPAANRRRTIPLEQSSSRRRRFALPVVLIGSALILVLAFTFVVPLDTSQGQHPATLAQDINNLISTGQFGGANTGVNTAGHIATPTFSALLHEGYCGGTDIWGVCARALTDSGAVGTGQMQRPIQGAIITQPFGHPEYQLWCGCWKPHTGIDLATTYGTPVTAADSGEVIWTGWDWSGLGWAVKISHGNYIATIYGHLQRFIVKVGQNVNKGQVIAYEGSTGASTGPHVHFMVLVNNIWVDPTLYMALP